MPPRQSLLSNISVGYQSGRSSIFSTVSSLSCVCVIFFGSKILILTKLRYVRALCARAAIWMFREICFVSGLAPTSFELFR